MATHTDIKLVDDLDGGPADETVQFSIDGRDYEIDLSIKHAQALHENLADYIEHARRAGKPDKPRPAPPQRRRCPAQPRRNGSDPRVGARERPRGQRPRTHPEDGPRGVPGRAGVAEEP
jgi:hypothetical protein